MNKSHARKDAERMLALNDKRGAQLQELHKKIWLIPNRIVETQGWGVSRLDCQIKLDKMAIEVIAEWVKGYPWRERMQGELNGRYTKYNTPSDVLNAHAEITGRDVWLWPNEPDSHPMEEYRVAA